MTSQLHSATSAVETMKSGPFSSPMLSQLVGNHLVSDVDKTHPIPTNEVSDGQDDIVESGSRAVENRLLRKAVGKQFISAREMAGLAQSEAASKIGWGTSAQLCLIEHGERMPPLAVLVRASIAFGCSADYLLGLSKEPERDAFAASRAGAFRRMQGLLEANARVVVEALLDATRGDVTTELRSIRFVPEINALLDGVDTFCAANAKEFDDMRAGAQLVRRAKDAREALDKIVNLMGRLDRRAEFTIARARAEMAAENATRLQ